MNTITKLKKSQKIKIVLPLIIGVIFIAGAYATYQVLTLRKAHSTFENYYAFRGCTQLVSRTDTTGICKLSSGQTITLVQIGGQWYLQGDGPGIW